MKKSIKRKEKKARMAKMYRDFMKQTTFGLMSENESKAIQLGWRPGTHLRPFRDTILGSAP